MTPTLHTSHQTSPTAGDLSGTTLLGRYRVMGVCGTGGFGSVLACWDTRLQRQVAIKKLPLTSQSELSSQNSATPASPELNASTLNEALTEARSASRLSHPGIVSVHDFAVDSTHAYIVMEYIEGLTLSELLSRVEGGTLTHDEAAYLALKLGDALSFAHKNNVLHLDIKPSNILFSASGEVKLCDFGVATLASAAGYGDARGGTVGYMPPEQIEGDLVDERSDVFALAVVLVESLSGRCVFTAQTAEESLLRIQAGIKPKLSRLDPGLNKMVQELLQACLSAEPTQRPVDIGELSADLAFGLGDPKAGHESLKELLTQNVQNDVDTHMGNAAVYLPLSYRYPRLWDALLRLCTAACAAIIAIRLFPLVSPKTVPAFIVGVLAAATTALFPPLAAILLFILLALALVITQMHAASVMLAAFLVGAGLVCIRTSFHIKGSPLALVLAPAFLSPGAAVCVPAALLPPFWAAVFSGISVFVARLFLIAEQNTFIMSAMLASLTRLATLPFFVELAGSMCAAAAGAWLTRSAATTSRAVAGQALGAALIIFSRLFAAKMENSGIWPTPTWDTVGISLTLGMLMCFALVLRDPYRTS